MDGNTDTLKIEPLVGTQAWTAFHQLRQHLYGGDAAWVEPLHHTTEARWSRKNAWFEHASAHAWLARLNDEVVGAISAQFDRRALDGQGRPIGYFGQFECIDNPSVAQGLFATARQWLQQHGAVVMKGPFDLHINDGCGLLVDGFEAPPMMMMPHHPRHYDALLKSVGLEPEIQLYAYTVSPDFTAPKVMRRLVVRHSNRLQIRRLNRRQYAQEIELLRSLFNDAWRNNWGFVPFSEKEFQAIGRELGPLLRSEYTAIAMLDDEPVGFLIALPNINELIRDFGGRLWPFNAFKLLWRLKTGAFHTARVPLMGVRSDFHQGPLGAVIAFSMIDAVRWPLHESGVTDVEMSWILETNDGMNALIEAMGGVRYKTYQMYQCPLETS